MSKTTLETIRICWVGGTFLLAQFAQRGTVQAARICICICICICTHIYLVGGTFLLVEFTQREGACRPPINHPSTYRIQPTDSARVKIKSNWVISFFFLMRSQSSTFLLFQDPAPRPALRRLHGGLQRQNLQRQRTNVQRSWPQVFITNKQANKINTKHTAKSTTKNPAGDPFLSY